MWIDKLGQRPYEGNISRSTTKKINLTKSNLYANITNKIQSNSYATSHRTLRSTNNLRSVRTFADVVAGRPGPSTRESSNPRALVPSAANPVKIHVEAAFTSKDGTAGKEQKLGQVDGGKPGSSDTMKPTTKLDVWEGWDLETNQNSLVFADFATDWQFEQPKASSAWVKPAASLHAPDHDRHGAGGFGCH